MPGEWKRPESVPYPQVWSRFEGKREINGKIPKFWIQDVPDDMYETVADFMCSNYIYEEPLSKYSNMIADKESIEECRHGWVMFASSKMALICFMENPDPNEKPIIAGANITSSSIKNESFPDFSGKSLNKVVNTVKYLFAQKDVYEMIDDDKYLTAIGMSVLPEFRGQGIGEQLLLARTPLCKALGLKATFTIFTSSASQKLAERTGFKDVVNISYDDLEKVDPNFSYPGITAHTKNIRLMYKLIE